jgi:hypothetical protein
MARPLPATPPAEAPKDEAKWQRGLIVAKGDVRDVQHGSTVYYVEAHVPDTGGEVAIQVSEAQYRQTWIAGLGRDSDLVWREGEEPRIKPTTPSPASPATSPSGAETPPSPVAASEHASEHAGSKSGGIQSGPAFDRDDFDRLCAERDANGGPEVWVSFYESTPLTKAHVCVHGAFANPDAIRYVPASTRDALAAKLAAAEADRVGMELLARHNADLARDALSKLARAEEELAEAQVCNTCGGDPPVSGLPCVCGGQGTAGAELVGLRLTALRATAAEAKLAEVAEAKSDTKTVYADMNRIVGEYEDTLHALRARVEGMGRALEWYANPDTWRHADSTTLATPALDDRGGRARAALADDGKEGGAQEQTSGTPEHKIKSVQRDTLVLWGLLTFFESGVVTPGRVEDMKDALRRIDAALGTKKGA